MKIRKKYDPTSGTYRNFNIITHEWETGSEATIQSSGSGLFDTLTKVASNIASKSIAKVTSDTAKSAAKELAKTALESASKKAGDELGKYAVERIKDKVSHKVSHKVSPSHIDADLIVKKLESIRPEITSLPTEGRITSPSVKQLYRGGSEATFSQVPGRGNRIKKIFKKYNI